MLRFLTQPLLEIIMINVEEGIMQCWQIVDELSYIAEAAEGNDKVTNMLLGLKELYQIKFDRLWEAYELSIKSGTIVNW